LSPAPRRFGFLTPARVRVYPALTFIVLAALAVYDRAAGHGLVNAIDGALGGDFLSFYTGGAFVREGRAAELSTEPAQLAFQQAVLGGDVQGTALWVSPPFFAWVFAPFSRLPYAVAYLCFVALSVAVVTVAFRALGRELGDDLPARKKWWIALQYYPTLQWLLNGQMTGLWLSALVAVFLLLRARRDAAAGAVLGLFACKPTLAFGLAVALLVARRFRTLLVAAATAAALVIIGFLTLPEAMKAYLHSGGTLVSFVQSEGYRIVGLHGSFEFATLLLGGVSKHLAVAIGTLSCAGVVAATAALWFRVEWRPRSREWDLRMAATLVFGLISSPHLFVYDLTLLMLPLFIVAARVSSTTHGLPLDGGPVLRAAAVVWVFGLVGPVLSLMQDHVTRTLFGFSAIVQVGVPAVLLWGIAIRGIISNPRETGQPDSKAVAAPSRF
jgi:alpha-1,2-mannosyltransferase